jgi:sirohydrochlorin ferrochelatase
MAQTGHAQTSALSATWPAVKGPLYSVAPSPVVMWTVDRNLQIATTMEGSGPPERRTTVSRFFDATDEHAEWPVAAHVRAQSGLGTVADLERQGTRYSARVSPLFRTDGLLVGSIGYVVEATQRRVGPPAATLGRELDEAVAVVDRALLMLRASAEGGDHTQSLDEIDVATRSIQSVAQRLRQRGRSDDDS